MSSMTASRTDIDVLITAATYWTANGGYATIPEDLARWLDNQLNNPDGLGTALMVAIYDQFNFEAPRDKVDPGLVASLEDSDLVEEPPRYVFDRVPGTPRLDVVARCLAFWRYQLPGAGLGGPDPYSDNDDVWVGTTVDLFLTAMNGIVQGLGEGRNFETEPGFDDLPWGLTDDQRGIFLRT